MVKVLTGSVTVSVIDRGGAVVEPLKCDAVTLIGCNVAEVTVGLMVGKGCTGGLPSVAMVVMIEPVVMTSLGTLSVGDCVFDISVNVSVSSLRRSSKVVPR